MINQDNQLIILSSNNEALTTTLAIAEGCLVEHKSVIQLTRQYLQDLEDFRSGHI